MTPAGTVPAMRSALGTAQAAVVLALLLGLQPVLTDVYLPTLPLIAHEFAAPLAATQMTMSALILAFGLMQLVWGPVADRFGRRPVLVWNLLLMLLASLGAMGASTIGWLIAWRVAQGATLAAVVCCARAMVRDLYAPAQGARVMAFALTGLGFVAIAAPVAGGVAAGFFGWRTGLGVVAACVAGVGVTIVLRLPETLAAPDPQALQVGRLARNARTVLVNPTFLAWALLVSSTYAGLFLLLSASSYVYIGALGMTSLQYGLAMGGGSLVYVVGTFFCRHWLLHHGMARTVRRGAFFTLAGGLAMAGAALMAQPPVALVLLAHGLYTFGHGMHQPCGQAGAVGPFPQMAGVASALAGCLLALVAFFVGLALGATMDGTLRPIGAGLALAAIATATVAWTLVQSHGQGAKA